MPWNGSGTYSPPAASFPEVNGTVIDAGRYNPTITDAATGITNTLAKDGQNVPTANLPMGGFKHTGAADAAAAGQYAVYAQAISFKSVVVTDSTVVSNGMYLPAANTLGLSSNTTLRWSVNSTGNHVFAAASSGYTAQVAGGLEATSGVALPVDTANSGVSVGYLVGAVTSTTGAYVAWLKDTQALNFSATNGTLLLSARNAAGAGLVLATKNTGRFQLAYAGNITIPAPDSGDNLAITSLNGSNGVKISTAGQAQISMLNTSASVTAVAGADASRAFFGAFTAHTVSLFSNSLERLVITSGGNATINAPSSGTALTVNAVAAGAAIVANAAAGSWTQIALAVNGTSKWALITDNAGVGYFSLYNTSRSADTLTITPAGNWTVAAPSGGTAIAVTAVAGQSAIVATGAANVAAVSATTGVKVGNSANTDTTVLDWYEEGTFTPTITFGGAAVGVAYTTQTGKFTRIGNMVTFSADVLLSSKGSSAGQLDLLGLPYAGSASLNQAGIGVKASQMTGLTTGLGGYVAAGGTNVTLQQGSTTGTTIILDTNCQNNTRITVAGTYLV